MVEVVAGGRVLGLLHVGADARDLRDIVPHVEPKLRTLTPPVVVLRHPATKRGVAVLKLQRRGSREAHNLRTARAALPVPLQSRVVLVLDTASDTMILEHVDGVPLRCGVTARSLKDALAVLPKITRLELATALRSLVETLCALHAAIPGFAHNDLKADNVLLRADGTCVLIDGETMAGAGLEPIDLGVMPDAARTQFGLGAANQWCSMTDLHLILLEIAVRVAECKQPPPWAPEFWAVCDALCPRPALRTWAAGNRVLCTRLNRLSPQGQRAINELQACGRLACPSDVLSLPFFQP